MSEPTQSMSLLDVLTRVVGVLGGSGGLMYWIDRFRNRSRLRVRLLREQFPCNVGGPALVKFEVENIGRDPMSLKETVLLSALTPQRKSRWFSFTIGQSDRSLPVHSPKTIEAFAPDDDVLPFLWYKHYSLVPTRGRSTHVFSQCAGNLRMSIFGYVFGRIVFRLTGKALPPVNRDKRVPIA